LDFKDQHIKDLHAYTSLNQLMDMMLY